MHNLAQINWVLILNGAKDICSGLLMVLGGLAVVAKYTKYDPDEKVIGIIEQVLKFIVMAVPTMISILMTLKPKGNADDTGQDDSSNG